MIDGVDVSRHQRPSDCDWQAAHAQGIRYCFVKITEGLGYVDPAARDHVTRLRESRVIPAGYHFARPDLRFREHLRGDYNGQREAEHACDHAVRFGLDADVLPLALDLEWGGYRFTSPVNRGQRDDFVRAFVSTTKRLLGRWPVIYTGAPFWRAKHSPALAVELSDIGCPLWLVNYTRKPKPTKAISGWVPVWWQWSGGGEVTFASPLRGLPHPIDRNRFAGGLGELHAFAGRPLPSAEETLS